MANVKHEPISMSVEELLALPASVPLLTAGRAFGLGRNACHTLLRAGEFPCDVIKLGHRYRVARSAILDALGIPDPAVAPAARAAEPAA